MINSNEEHEKSFYFEAKSILFSALELKHSSPRASPERAEQRHGSGPGSGTGIRQKDVQRTQRSRAPD